MVTRRKCVCTTQGGLRHLGLVVWLAGLVVAMPAVSQAQSELSARAVMERNDEQMRVRDGIYELEMRIVDASGRETVRGLRREAYRSTDQDEWSLLRFQSPADVEGTGLLSIEKGEAQDDVYLYLPALRKSRRISGRNNRDYFMGSDFTYKDLRSERLKANRYERLPDEMLDGELCARIVAYPTTDAERDESGYERRELWVSQTTWLVLKTEFYDEHGENLKTLTATDIRPVQSGDDAGKLRAHELLMVNHDRERRTVLEFDAISLNTGLPKSRFTKRALERP